MMDFMGLDNADILEMDSSIINDTIANTDYMHERFLDFGVGIGASLCAASIISGLGCLWRCMWKCRFVLF